MPTESNFSPVSPEELASLLGLLREESSWIIPGVIELHRAQACKLRIRYLTHLHGELNVTVPADAWQIFTHMGLTIRFKLAEDCKQVLFEKKT